MFQNYLATGRCPRLAMEVSAPLVVVYTECSKSSCSCTWGFANVASRSPRKQMISRILPAASSVRRAEGLQMCSKVCCGSPKGSFGYAVGLQGGCFEVSGVAFNYVRFDDYIDSPFAVVSAQTQKPNISKSVVPGRLVRGMGGVLW